MNLSDVCEFEERGSGEEQAVDVVGRIEVQCGEVAGLDVVGRARLVLGGRVGAAAVERERGEVDVSLRGGGALSELVERREAVRVRRRAVELVVAELRLATRLLLLVFVPAREASGECDRNVHRIRASRRKEAYVV